VKEKKIMFEFSLPVWDGIGEGRWKEAILNIKNKWNDSEVKFNDASFNG
jgi:hypothetical protein